VLDCPFRIRQAGHRSSRRAGNSARQNGYGSSDDKRVHVDRTQTAAKLVVLPAERPGPVGRRAAVVISRHGSRRSERATDRQHMLMCPQSVGRSAQRRATDRQRQCPQNINLSDPLMTISDRYYSSRQSPSVGRRSELATAPAKVDCTYALKPLTSLVVWTSVTRSTTADPKAV